MGKKCERGLTRNVCYDKITSVIEQMLFLEVTYAT